MLNLLCKSSTCTQLAIMEGQQVGSSNCQISCLQNLIRSKIDLRYHYVHTIYDFSVVYGRVNFIAAYPCVEYNTCILKGEGNQANSPYNFLHVVFNTRTYCYEINSAQTTLKSCFHTKWCAHNGHALKSTGTQPSEAARTMSVVFLTGW